MRRITILLLTAFMVASCTTVDPYTGEEKTSKATKGAIIGAVSGAIVGALFGDDSTERRQKALIGAGVGALTGAAIGNYMDRQEAKLREELAGTGVSVTRIGDEILLNMPGNITLAFDSADLNTEFVPVLNSVGKVLAEFNQTVIEVKGHTDSTGSDEYNQELSERRAASVSTYMTGQGINELRVITFGFGETSPIADNESPEGRQRNRRVELNLVPLTEPA